MQIEEDLLIEILNISLNKFLHFCGVLGLVLSIIFYVLQNNKYKAMKYLIIDLKAKNEKLENINHSLEESVVKIEALLEKKF